MNATGFELPISAILGGTSLYSIVKAGEKYYVENHDLEEEATPLLPIPEQLVPYYVAGLERYLDLDPDNSEEARLLAEDDFNSMCQLYFEDGY